MDDVLVQSSQRSLRTRRALLTVPTAVALVALMFFVTRPNETRPRSTRNIMVSCGQTIVVNGTDDVRITNSLSDCPGDGLIITGKAQHSYSSNGWPSPGLALGGSVNLNGNSISGLGVGAGIRNEADIMVLENGVISGFQQGIFNGRDLLVERVKVSGCETGIASSGGSEGTIPSRTSLINDNVFGNRADGAQLAGSVAYVSGGTYSGNAGAGITISASDAAVVGATAVSNAKGIVVLHGDTVTNNIANSNSGDGIVVGAPSRIDDNEVDFNAGYGINSVPGSTGTNRAKGNSTAAQCLDIACT